MCKKTSGKVGRAYVGHGKGSMKESHCCLLSFHLLPSFTFQSYNCLCQPGWEGEFCQRESDECSSNPCKNNATCTDLLNAYRWAAQTQPDAGSMCKNML